MRIPAAEGIAFFGEAILCQLRLLIVAQLLRCLRALARIRVKVDLVGMCPPLRIQGDGLTVFGRKILHGLLIGVGSFALPVRLRVPASEGIARSVKRIR